MLALLRPLRSKNVARVWSSALLSNVGAWKQAVALGAEATARSHDPSWSAAASIPIGVRGW